MLSTLSSGLLVLWLTAIVVSPCSAQVSDVFASAFKSLVGINLSISFPYYSGGGNAISMTGPLPPLIRTAMAYSVKFAPFKFGPIVPSDTSSEVQILVSTTYVSLDSITYRVVSDTIKKKYVNGTANALVTIDSTHSESLALIHKGGPTPATKQYKYFLPTWGPSLHLSLSLGYEVDPDFQFVGSSGFSAEFPINAVFVTATTRLWPSTLPHLLLGASISVPTLSNAPAQYTPPSGTPTRIRVSSAPTFSPELFVGYSATLTDRLEAFLDASYKFQEFRGLTYTDPSSGKEPTFVDQLPTLISASGCRMRLGISFNVGS